MGDLQHLNYTNYQKNRTVQIKKLLLLKSWILINKKSISFKMFQDRYEGNVKFPSLESSKQYSLNIKIANII